LRCKVLVLVLTKKAWSWSWSWSWKISEVLVLVLVLKQKSWVKLGIGLEKKSYLHLWPLGSKFAQSHYFVSLP